MILFKEKNQITYVWSLDQVLIFYYFLVQWGTTFENISKKNFSTIYYLSYEQLFATNMSLGKPTIT